MVTIQQETQCVLWLAESKSMKTVRRTFLCVYANDPPHANNISRWKEQFQEAGSVGVKKSPGRPKTSAESVKGIRHNASCLRSLKI